MITNFEQFKDSLNEATVRFKEFNAQFKSFLIKNGYKENAEDNYANTSKKFSINEFFFAFYVKPDWVGKDKKHETITATIDIALYDNNYDKTHGYHKTANVDEIIGKEMKFIEDYVDLGVDKWMKKYDLQYEGIIDESLNVNESSEEKTKLALANALIIDKDLCSKMDIYDLSDKEKIDYLIKSHSLEDLNEFYKEFFKKEFKF
jgi:hypothetical protein